MVDSLTPGGQLRKTVASRAASFRCIGLSSFPLLPTAPTVDSTNDTDEPQQLTSHHLRCLRPTTTSTSFMPPRRPVHFKRTKEREEAIRWQDLERRPSATPSGHSVPLEQTTNGNVAPMFRRTRVVEEIHSYLVLEAFGCTRRYCAFYASRGSRTRRGSGASCLERRRRYKNHDRMIPSTPTSRD